MATKFVSIDRRLILPSGDNTVIAIQKDDCDKFLIPGSFAPTRKSALDGLFNDFGIRVNGKKGELLHPDDLLMIQSIKEGDVIHAFFVPVTSFRFELTRHGKDWRPVIIDKYELKNNCEYGSEALVAGIELTEEIRRFYERAKLNETPNNGTSVIRGLARMIENEISQTKIDEGEWFNLESVISSIAASVSMLDRDDVDHIIDGIENKATWRQLIGFDGSYNFVVGGAA
ncbi:MAG: hypothetical protein D6732_08425 [Methanobacteriota archaeon]|nr:MAG: hypothetical protein D6732_08425 [Euryarchaeota archaeon]